MDGAVAGLDAAALTARLGTAPAVPPLDETVCQMLAEAALEGALAGIAARRREAETPANKGSAS